MGQEQSVQSARGSKSECDNMSLKDDTRPRKASLAGAEEIQCPQERVNNDGLKSYNFLINDTPFMDGKANDDIATSRSLAQEVKGHDQQRDQSAHSLEERAMAINFGDDEGQQGRYVNQFGEISRATSYKLFRGGNGSVNSISSLAQFSSSEHGSASVNDLVIDAADKDEAMTDYSAEEMKEVAKQDILNQFGCVQRVESCVLFGVVEDAAVQEVNETLVAEEVAPKSPRRESRPAGENEGIINQFGTVVRSESGVLFGVNDEVEEVAKKTDEAAESTRERKSIDETTSQHCNKKEILNQFGTMSSHPSCVLFGVEDDAAEAAREVIADDQAAKADLVSDEPFHGALGEPERDQIMVNFGDDKETKDDELKGKGRYINQFGEIARSTSYKMLRGGTGSVNSLSSLNQFGGSELGSSLGSVCEMNVLEDDNMLNDGELRGSGPDAKHAPVTDVMNQFGHIARVESAALFRTESAASLALSRAAESATDAEDIDGDFF